ncbi:hypothetical protein ACO0K8_03245 [Undibacterium sp. Ren11W]
MNSLLHYSLIASLIVLSTAAIVLGGGITVHSSAQNGSAFLLRLPICAPTWITASKLTNSSKSERHQAA